MRRALPVLMWASAPPRHIKKPALAAGFLLSDSRRGGAEIESARAYCEEFGSRQRFPLPRKGFVAICVPLNGATRGHASAARPHLLSVCRPPLAHWFAQNAKAAAIRGTLHRLRHSSRT